MDPNWLSVSEVAQRLGVSQARVRQRIADGSLAADRISGRWLIPAASVRAVSNVGRSRPLSEPMAWAVLRYLADTEIDIDWLTASERLRARTYADRLRNDSDPAPIMRAWLKSRANRRLLRAAEGDLAELVADDRIRLSGVMLPDSGLVTQDIVEGYVSPADVESIVDDYFLVSAVGRDANVILHVADARVDPASVAVIAADLAEHNGPREDGRVEELVHGAR